MGTDFDLTLTDEKVVLRRVLVYSEWQWQSFRQVTETSRCWTLITAERQAILIPKLR